jgi:hypothetical protein
MSEASEGESGYARRLQLPDLDYLTIDALINTFRTLLLTPLYPVTEGLYLAINGVVELQKAQQSISEFLPASTCPASETLVDQVSSQIPRFSQPSGSTHLWRA